MTGLLQPVNPNAYTLNSVGGSSLYPTSPTLTSAQAEANPLASGVMLPGADTPFGTGQPNDQPATLLGTLAAGSQVATNIGSGVSSVTGFLSTLQNLLSGASLERALIILIGVIMLGIGLWMLKGGTTVNIAGAVARAT